MFISTFALALLAKLIRPRIISAHPSRPFSAVTRATDLPCFLAGTCLAHSALAMSYLACFCLSLLCFACCCLQCAFAPFSTLPRLSPQSLADVGQGKGKGKGSSMWRSTGRPAWANLGCVSCAAWYKFLSSSRPKWDAMTFRSYPFVAPVPQRHRVTHPVRQSVYHHSRGHRSILGPGSSQTCNICSRRYGSIRSSVPCVLLSPLNAQCSRGWVTKTAIVHASRGRWAGSCCG